MLMLERVRPGVPLGVCPDDEENTRIAARLMKKFWRPVPKIHTFRPTAYEIDGFDKLRKKYNGGTGPLPEEWVVRAETLYDELDEYQYRNGCFARRFAPLEYLEFRARTLSRH